MNLLQFHHISLILGARPIFEDIQWEIQDGQKIGLIGANGAGKSSLFKMIMGEYQPEQDGKLVFARDLSIGYLPQHPELDGSLTALQAALQGKPRWQILHGQLAGIEQSLSDPLVYEHDKKLAAVLEEQQHVLDEYFALGGDQYPLMTRQILSGLGLEENRFDTPIKNLSGGQKKLVGLARIMLGQPKLILLDEPDNHLDLRGKQFLEQWIRSYQGAVILVSHDRYLLDAAVTDIAELEDGHLTVFNGDYSQYMIEKELRLARQQALYQVQQHEIARIETAIKRYAIWARTYDNEKFAKRAKAIQNRLDKMERLEKPQLERRRMDLQINGWRGSSKVLQFKQAGKSFGEKKVLNGLDFTLLHGERVGIIGGNGSGKSVLLRLAAGMLEPDGGDVQLGPSIQCGYYAQEHETLDFSQSLIDCVQRAGNMSEGSAVSYLRKFLFTYRQASQQIGQLSGGERSRLQLALIVLSGANFLLLDEPTNNLDIQSAEVLEDALADFDGTVLVISHDRYFLDRVVERILVVENQNITPYLGGYSEYLEQSR